MEGLILIAAAGLVPGVLVATVLTLVLGTWYLVVAGFRNGVRPEDSKLDIDLAWDYRFDRWGLFSTIRVDNPGHAPAIITSHARPAWRLVPWQRTSFRVSSPLRRQPLGEESTVLGVVDRYQSRAWDLPVECDPSRPMVELGVRVDQDSGRMRVFRYRLTVPPHPAADGEWAGDEERWAA